MVQATKHSRQRDALKELLYSRCDHPTAEMLYTDLKTEFPKISLATVYRNLNTFEKNGEILRIADGSGTDRYDGCNAPHYHFSCCNCGGVSDVEIPFDYSLNTKAEQATGGVVKTQNLIFYGVCGECLKNN